ncbi:hypothetical protein KIW84_031123 [Lathyrus oleraceus]|uniref:MATH domain-containing protein n=1 Tax=Pisum sativum TaxID=3888 RepID=A0A9D4XR32_PEA|nr:hypothetical protein KIW84_031123 [Pisum sativum]
MEHEQSTKFEKFTWKVENFSKYNTDVDVYSEPFIIGGYPWKIIFNQSAYEVGDISVYLSAVETANMSNGWSRHVKFNLFVVNQIDNNESSIEEKKYALGRVLYFLKTRKMKDMNDIACKELQIFWEELGHFGFDLTWLEPHVQSALGMKRFLEKLKEVEKLKDNEALLELEIMRMKAKMVALEINLHAVKDLLEAEEFEGIWTLN